MNQPKTIEELRIWFRENGYEPATTRFFVGVDFRAPKAFGIYKNELGEFVVYKNKADGTRVIRYQGDDEEFAVHELYQRFQEEIINQQTRWMASHTVTESKKTDVSSKHVLIYVFIAVVSFILSRCFFLWLRDSQGIDLGLIVYLGPTVVMALALFLYKSYLDGKSFSQSYFSIPTKYRMMIMAGLIMLVVCSTVVSPSEKNGYYSIDNSLYYRAGNNWYHYNTSGRTWSYAYNVPRELTSGEWNDYHDMTSYGGSYNLFETTSYYHEWKSSNTSGSYSRDSDDRDYDGWSSDNWDSGSTDWDSDW